MSKTIDRRTLLQTVAGLGLGAAFVGRAGAVLAQQFPGGNLRDALAQPFVGLTTDGKPRAGLFPIGKTGVSTVPVLLAAQRFLASLSDSQRRAVLFPVDDSEWRNWANIHRFPRQGVPLSDMTDEQRGRAYDLLRATLSAKGYLTARDIMRLNYHLAELVGNFTEYGEHLYWISMMGEPSADGPWGWQIDGHHLVVNAFVLGDQIVMTPTFMGSEPVRADTGRYAGAVILQDEQAQGLAFMRALPAAQQTLARIGSKTGRSSNVAEMMKDNVVVPYAGLSAAVLTAAQRDALMALIGLYVGNLRDGHAAVRLAEVRARLDETHFAWRGAADEDAVFYYRIHSPVIFIEFDHQGPIALDGPGNTATRRHIHTVVRTPNGNDYGKDLLRQHLEAHKNDPAHGHAPQ